MSNQPILEPMDHLSFWPMDGVSVDLDGERKKEVKVNDPDWHNPWDIVQVDLFINERNMGPWYLVDSRKENDKGVLMNGWKNAFRISLERNALIPNKCQFTTPHNLCSICGVHRKEK